MRRGQPAPLAQLDQREKTASTAPLERRVRRVLAVEQLVRQVRVELQEQLAHLVLTVWTVSAALLVLPGRLDRLDQPALQG